VRSEDEAELARLVAQTWLERYGIVGRDIQRREQPSVPWRAVYEQLRDMELRRMVRRGYFVQGLAGAQFALPDAVERLREVSAEVDPAGVCMSVRDPANAYRWAHGWQETSGDGVRPRSGRGLLVTRGGRPVLAVEGRMERVRTLPNARAEDLPAAAHALTRYLRRSGAQSLRPREFRIRTIDDASAVRSDAAAAFVTAGWRKVGLELIFDPRRENTGAPT
jgi:ATP-dependent Lhr-like helicase